MRALIVAFTICLMLSVKGFSVQTDTLIYRSIGKIIIYKPLSVPEEVVLFVSGDGGWNKGVIDMAKHVVSQGAMVAGIDIVDYYSKLKKLTNHCLYPASDFEQLSIIIQKKYRLHQYHKPILIGYSSGATFVYGLLAQAPSNTFKGAIALGFCPDIELDKPLCSGSGLKQHLIREGFSYYLESSEHLESPFIVLQGTKDQVCSYDATKQYMKDMQEAELITLPKVGHGFSVEANWLPQFLDAYKRMAKAPSYTEQKAAQNKLLQGQYAEPLPDYFPITLVPSAKTDSLPLVFMISGDGGWTSFDQTMGETFAEKGMPVIGLDAQKYFWNSKTPEETTGEIDTALRYYLGQWGRNRFIMVGYSFGASIVPFVINRIPADMQSLLAGSFCLSPEEYADFEIHITDMLSLGNSKDIYNVVEEIRRNKINQPVCIFGEEENAEERRKFSETGATVILQPGDHHYNNNPAGIAETIILEMKTIRKYNR
jgi:type IV secretory pathway VirJ component